MAATYKCQTRETFEYELANMANEFGLQLRDLTEPYHTSKGSWERVYEFTTKNPAVRLLVFSSVDIRTGKFRECGGDAVRLDTWIKTSQGNKAYKKFKTHPRVETLFKNMRKSIKEVNEWATENGGDNIRRWAWGVDKNRRERAQHA